MTYTELAREHFSIGAALATLGWLFFISDPVVVLLVSLALTLWVTVAALNEADR